MHRSPMVLGLAAVFAGLTVLLLAAGAATGSVFVLFVALPLGITTAIMWLHGSGRLRASVRRRAARARYEDAGGFGSGRTAGPRAERGARPGGAAGTRRSAAGDRRRGDRRTAADGPFTGRGGPFSGGGRFGGSGRRRTREARSGAGTAADGSSRTRGRARVVQEGMSAREAAEVLGVDPGADEATVKRAYREQVKRHHPDVEGGDEATFKRVTEAYERLS